MFRVTQLVRGSSGSKTGCLAPELRSTALHCVKTIFHWGLGLIRFGFMQRLEAKGQAPASIKDKALMECRECWPGAVPSTVPAASTRVPTAFQLPQPCPLLSSCTSPSCSGLFLPLHGTLRSLAMSTSLLTRHQELPTTYKIKFPNLDNFRSRLPQISLYSPSK